MASNGKITVVIMKQRKIYLYILLVIILLFITKYSSRRIDVFPKGKQTEFKDFVSVFVTSRNKSPIQASFDIWIEGVSGNMKFIYASLTSAGSSYDKTGSRWGLLKFISRDDLFNKQKILIKDNTLTLHGKCGVPNKNSKFWLTNLKMSESEELNNIFMKRLHTSTAYLLQLSSHIEVEGNHLLITECYLLFPDLLEFPGKMPPNDLQLP
jgi:hypothetical protein